MSSIVRFTGVDPQEVLDKPSAVRLGMVETMLRQHGFERTERGKGSHFQYRYKNDSLGLDEIVGLIPKIGDDLNYQKSAARACIAVREAKIASAMRSVAGIAEGFDACASGKVLVDTIDHLPDTVIGEVDPETAEFVILRSKKYPQIGVVLPLQVVPESIDAYIKSLQVQEEGFEIEFNALLAMDCELERYEDDSIEFFNQYGDRKVLIEAYDPSVFQDPIGTMLLFHEALEADYEICDYFFKFDNGDCVHKVGENADGMSWEFLWTPHLGDNKEIALPFQTDKTGRIRKAQFYELYDQIRDLDFGGPQDRKRIQTMYRLRFGVEIRKPKRAKDFQGTHPLYDDIEFTLPDVNALPRMANLYQQLLNSDSDFERLELSDKIFEVNELTAGARLGISIANEDVVEQLKQARGIIQSVREQHGCYRAEVDSLEPGKVGNALYKNPYTQEPMSVRYMVLNNNNKEDEFEDFAIYHLADALALKQGLDVSKKQVLENAFEQS